MFESRCGVCCNQCERKEAVRCTGCATMEKPFWGGECGVKSCCEAKGLNHCGECPDFPCEMEASMGTDMGFDAEPRLKQCRESPWRRYAVRGYGGSSQSGMSDFG